jgi:hypothetical protein
MNQLRRARLSGAVTAMLAGAVMGEFIYIKGHEEGRREQRLRPTPTPPEPDPPARAEPEPEAEEPAA